ncbi:MAG: hypothetical protein ACO3M2_12645, partial [Pseudohongiellaceae bacterium]
SSRCDSGTTLTPGSPYPISSSKSTSSKRAARSPEDHFGNQAMVGPAGFLFRRRRASACSGAASSKLLLNTA